MNLRHGYKTRAKTYPEYAVWSGIIQRCCNPNHKSYSSYGGRKITVCKSWQDDFLNFLQDMGNRPTIRHTIERVNNNKGYSKSNCIWALPSSQSINKRNNVWVVYEGKKMLLLDYAKETRISFQAAHKRVQRTRASGRKALMDGTVVLRDGHE